MRAEERGQSTERNIVRVDTVLRVKSLLRLVLIGQTGGQRPDFSKLSSRLRTSGVNSLGRWVVHLQGGVVEPEINLLTAF